MKKLSILIAAASLAISAQAQTPAAPAATTGAPAAAAPATPAPKPLGMADKKFLKDLSEAILLEQKYLQVFTDAKPTLAETTQRDTNKITAELKRVWTALAKVATAKGAELATEVSKSDAAKIDKLSKEKPDKIVKEFFKDFGKETGRTVKLLDSAKSLQDPDVKVFVEDWSAVLKGHDKAAQAGEKSATAKK